MKIIYSKSELRNMEEILRRNATQYFEGKESLYTTKKMIRFLEGLLSNRRDKEYAGCVFMNSLRILLEVEILSEGCFTHVDLSPKIIFEKCIELDASHVVLFHNHPNGDGHPSKSDIESANNFNMILRSLDIELVDDIIIGKPGFSVSLNERGLLEKIESK